MGKYRLGNLVVVALQACAIGCTMLRPPAPPLGAVDQMREQVLAYLNLKPGMNIAEIGIGPGWFVIRTAALIGANGIIYGTDIDPERIELLRQGLPNIGPGRVDLRLCRDGRDTALDDLPDDSLDYVLMIDSLCFDNEYSPERNAKYLNGFLRVLRPGARLVHHMDCHCDVTTEGLVAQFTAAGFSPHFESFDVSPDPATLDPSWPCQSETERQRHAFVGVFYKP